MLGLVQRCAGLPYRRSFRGLHDRLPRARGRRYAQERTRARAQGVVDSQAPGESSDIIEGEH